MKPNLVVNKIVAGKASPVQCILAFFDAEALLEDVGENGNIEMMLATRLMSGQAVYGTDQVRIFAPRRRPHRWKR